MRILHLDPDDMDNPLSGGGPVRTFEICRRLARRHEVTVLTPTFPGSTPEMEREGIRYLRLGRKVREHGSSHHITYLAALPQAVRRHPHDLMVEDFMPPCSVTWAPLFQPRPRVRIASVQWFYARDYTARLKLPFHWGEHVGLRLHRHFVVLSEAMRQLIGTRRPGADCRVLPNGIDQTLFDVEPAVGHELLYLGRIEVNSKGIDLLLQALAKMPEARRPVLQMAGNLQEPEAFDHWLEHTGMRPWVRLHGPVNAAQRAELLRRCRCLVMPSRYETFGMVIAEAQAAAKPVVIWDRSPMNEVAGPSCYRVPASDTAALAATLAEVFAASDDELRERGRVAREFARRFDWDHIAQGQEAFYAEVLEHAQHRARRGGHAG